MARTCTTQWLLTLPVDVMAVNEPLLRTLAAEATGNGAFATDDDGLQPLVALWRVEALREAISAVVVSHDFAIHALQQRLKMTRVHLVGVRFGNLNTPADLIAAGMDRHHE